jgi:hypothetical protein
MQVWQNLSEEAINKRTVQLWSKKFYSGGMILEEDCEHLPVGDNDQLRALEEANRHQTE